MSEKTIEPYLFFGGCCEEAIQFYVNSLGAKLEMLMRYKESPVQTAIQKLPPGYEDKVMHASIIIGGSRVMASDGCETGTKFAGFSLYFNASSEAEADKVFTALVAGGTVKAPLAPTFWSPKFGMLTDRFGVDWMIGVSSGQE